MKVQAWYYNQIGLMITWGVNYENRKYVSLDIPFFIIQILGSKPKRNVLSIILIFVFSFILV